MLNKKVLNVFTGFMMFFSAFTAKAEDLFIQITPFSAIRNGQQNEYVYITNANDNDVLLSELNWEQKPLYILGLDAGVSFFNVEINTNGSFAIPGNTGSVYDSDWQNYTSSDSSISSLKTNYSVSSNEITSHYFFNINAGYRIKLNNYYSFKPFIAYEYSYSNYSAKDGNYWYGSKNSTTGYYYAYNDSDNNETGSFSGTVLELERITYFTWAGLTQTVKLNDFITFEGSFSIAPYAYVESLDTHPLRSYYFADIMDDILCGSKINVNTQLFINKHNKINLGFTAQSLEINKGTSYLKTSKNGSWAKEKDSYPGCSFNFIQAEIGFSLII